MKIDLLDGIILVLSGYLIGAFFNVFKILFKVIFAIVIAITTLPFKFIQDRVEYSALVKNRDRYFQEHGRYNFVRVQANGGTLKACVDTGWCPEQEVFCNVEELKRASSSQVQELIIEMENSQEDRLNTLANQYKLTQEEMLELSSKLTILYKELLISKQEYKVKIDNIVKGKV